MKKEYIETLYSRAKRCIMENKIDCLDLEENKMLYIVMYIVNFLKENEKDVSIGELSRISKIYIDRPDNCILKPVNELLEDYSEFKDSFNLENIDNTNNCQLVDQNHRDIIAFMYKNILSNNECYEELVFDIKEFGEKTSVNFTNSDKVSDLIIFAFTFYGLTIGTLLSVGLLKILGIYDDNKNSITE